MQTIEEIYKTYSSKVFLFLLSKTSNEQLAEELTQETFFQAVQNIDSFKGKSSMLTWLCAIAKNVWFKYLRKHKDTLSLDDTTIGDKVSTHANDASIRWDQKEILQIIHRMSDPMREIMYLRLVSNLSFAEIGEIIDKNENWVRVTFFRGKQLIIKEVLEDEK